MRTYKQAENVDNVEEGDGGSKVRYEDFSWWAEEAQEEQQYLPTCTYISKPVVQAPATGPNWNSYSFLADTKNKKDRKDKDQSSSKLKEERLLKTFTSNNLSLLSLFLSHNKEEKRTNLLGNLVVANVESG